MTLTDCVAKWINRREINLAASTISGYRRSLRKYIEPTEAGSTPIEKLDEDDMIEILRPLIAADHTRQAQLVQILVRAVLKDAVRHRQIQSNPMDFVDHVKHKSKFTAWLTVDQARQLLTSARDQHDPYYLAWLLMINCGLRRGEMLGLQWQDIDEAAKVLHVVRQKILVDGVVRETRPKTLTSIRDIFLDDELLTEIRLHKTPGTYILEKGTQDRLASALDRAAKAANVPRITPHGLRHTMAAAAASEDIPIKKLQSVLGHAHYSTTADIYAHVDQDSMRDVAKKLARATIPARLEIA